MKSNAILMLIIVLILSGCKNDNETSQATSENEETVNEEESVKEELPSLEEVMKNLTADSGVPNHFVGTTEEKQIQDEIKRLSAERNKSIHPHGRWSSSPKNIHLGSEKVEAHVEKYPPQIHMTDYEVLDSTWGKPQKIIKTTTQYGVKEQWVYSNNRYLYFEDGYLTTIRE